MGGEGRGGPERGGQGRRGDFTLSPKENHDTAGSFLLHSHFQARLTVVVLLKPQPRDSLVKLKADTVTAIPCILQSKSVGQWCGAVGCAELGKSFQ